MNTPKGLEKRSLILTQALELFVQKGYAATSMEDIVQHTGISKGSIYYHFSSKDELFMSMVEKINREWVDEWNEARSQFPDLESRLIGVSLHFVNSFQTPLAKVAKEFSMTMQEGYEQVLERLVEISMDQMNVFIEIFQEGIDQQIFNVSDPTKLAVMFTSMLSGFSIYPAVVQGEQIELYTKEAVDVLLNGIKKS